MGGQRDRERPERKGSVPDVPTGYTEGRRDTHPDAPDLPPDQAGEAARGNETTHSRGDGEESEEQGSADRGSGRAEEILPELDVEWRFDRGSDSESPVAGLLAAAAASPQPLDAHAYEAYVEAHPGKWPTARQLAHHYGSFAAALQAAGIQDPDRSIT